MKKLVRTDLTNTPSRRGTENLNIQFYSHDKNNAGFEFVIKNETDLTQYTPKVLFKFRDSNSTWQANGTIDGNIVKVNFNTDLIARCEEVLGFLFLDSDSDSLDIFKFKFNVVLSEIDKDGAEKRRIKHVENISSFDLVTRAELKDELTKLQISGGGNVDIENLVTRDYLDEYFNTRNSGSAIIQADKDIESYFLENTDSKDVDKIQVRGYVYNYVGETKIFKQKNGDDLEFVGFQGAMITLANVLPKDYDHYTFNDPEKRVTLLTDRNFKEVVPRDELKAIIKEILTELKSENN